MQANRNRFERKQLLQVFGEPEYDSPLLSASKTEQKRKSSPAATKDRSDKKRAKSVKKTSSAFNAKTIQQHKQCKKPGCVSRGTSVTHTHAQCFYKTAEKKAVPPTTNFWPIRRSHLLTQRPKHQTFPMEKPLAQRAMHSNFHLVPLRPYLERISVQLIALRVDKRDITPVIAQAARRASGSYDGRRCNICMHQAISNG